MTHFCETISFSDKNKREENQDICGCMMRQSAPAGACPAASVLFVADGVSNADGTRAVETISSEIYGLMGCLLSDCNDLYQMSEYQREREVSEQLRDLIQQLDQAVRSKGAGCATLSIALVLGSYVYTANIGDSPILLVELDDDNCPVELKELHETHNMAGAMVRKQEMTKEEALSSELRNQLSRRVVGQGVSRTDIYTAKTGLTQNNLLLLGSDGALSVLPDAELMELLADDIDKGLDEVNSQLFTAVQDHPAGDDNYTFLGQWIRMS